MEMFYKIIWVIAFSVDFCVCLAFLKAIALKWLEISLQNILEEREHRFREKRLAATEAIILSREARRVEE